MSEKWWSVLFGLVMFGCGAMFVVAPFVPTWWLPPGISSHSWDIDFLFYLILAVTGFFFILTEALLVYFMYRYCQTGPGETRKPSIYASMFGWMGAIFNTPKKIEMTWTVVPAIFLVYLAFAQVSTWADVKYKSRLEKIWANGDEFPLQVDLSARQFEWRFRYPSPATWKRWKADPGLAENWIRNPEFDDIRGVANELHIIKGRHVVVQLSTKDVLHSFNIPHMRVKQDALPGKTIPVWFKPLFSNVKREGDRWDDGGGRDPETGQPSDKGLVWQIACAELCGWGHYRMIGRTFVHETEEDFLAWLEWAAAHHNDVGSAAKKN